MPKQYERIKEKMLRKGKSAKAAKKSAARIFNAERKPGQKPVTGKHKSK